MYLNSGWISSADTNAKQISNKQGPIMIDFLKLITNTLNKKEIFSIIK